MVSDAEAERTNPEHGSLQPLDAQPECKICRNILEYTNGTDPDPNELTLGIAEDLLRSQCSHVALFQDWLRDVLKGDPDCAKSLLSIERDEECEFIYFLLQSSPGEDGSYYTSGLVGLLRMPTVPDHPGVMRAVDPQWVDVSLLKQWIRTCDEEHGHRCRQSLWLGQSEPTRPQYLVDTWEMCVVKGDRVEAEYIALSYQWGQTKTLRNTTKVRERLLKPSSLSEWDLACSIPQTIRDAFGVVRLLGYRYLWVDALCVVQDDHAELAVELRRMHLIYNSASFTIVAADGIDASYGLLGLEGLTAARNHPQKLIPLIGSERMAIHHPSPHYENSHDQGAYETRAWTFQEYNFSLRRIVFHMDAVEWHCNHIHTREDLIEKVPEPVDDDDDDVRPLSSPFSTVPQKLATELPMPRLLANLVNAFNVRNLSFPEDAFPAFAGIQSLLEQYYQPGFLYGLPEFWFELALSWIPDDDLERRIASSSKCPAGTSYRLPSWSWIGWTGKIQFPDDEVGDAGRFSGTFTEPVTKWYALAQPASIDRRPIASAWHEYLSMAIEDHFVTLPQGWQQRNDPNRGIVFIHTRRPNLKLLYPFPVPEPCSTSVSISVPQTAYLATQTSRAFLHGKTVENTPYNFMSGYRLLWLQSTHDQTVGFLHLNNAEQESLFGRAFSTSSGPNPLELVAISKGVSEALFPPELDWEVEWERIYYMRRRLRKRVTRPNIDCMFVLWIEWEDGVAYRRACGTVTAEAWEQARERELVDLILG